MIRQNLHTHSTFGDGKNTCEEIVLSALQKGFLSVGFSEHAYAPYDTDCCIKQEDIPRYFAEVNRLKKEFAGQIEIFLGFECDYYCYPERAGLDFTIGSVHSLFDKASGEYFTIDDTPEAFEQGLNRMAGGDVETFVKIYYRDVADMAHEYKPDIVGHLDLITKLNRNNRYFDPKSPWYRRIMRETAGKIAETGCIVEVNTGGMSRGVTDMPYPSIEILSELFDLHVPLTISSDAHSADSLDFWFSETVELLKKTGFRSIKQLTADGFVDVEI